MHPKNDNITGLLDMSKISFFIIFCETCPFYSERETISATESLNMCNLQLPVSDTM